MINGFRGALSSVAYTKPKHSLVRLTRNMAEVLRYPGYSIHRILRFRTLRSRKVGTDPVLKK
jgi:hypothetical protein